MIDADVGTGLPQVGLTDRQHGLAALVRHNGRPLAFILRPQQPETTVTPGMLASWVRDEAGERALEQCIEDSLTPSARADGGPDITVAVCTRNRGLLLEDCLRSILDEVEGCPAVDVLVVDNAPSSDAARRLVAGLPGIRYACEPRAGANMARNRALREAAGEWIAFVDDDAVVDRGWLGGLVDALRAHPDATVVTGLILPRELATGAQIAFETRGGFRQGLDQVRFEGSDRADNPLYPCAPGMFGAGCAMAVDRDAILRLGGFDEKLDTADPFLGCGDLDVFYRVIRADGVLVYEPRMLVFHRHRRSHRELRRQLMSWGEGLMALTTKSYREDPSQRPKLRLLVRWWFRGQAEALWSALRGRGDDPPDLIAAQIWGGVRGLAGAYGRAARRSARAGGR